MTPVEAREKIAADSRRWPPAANRSNKVQCPLCGTKGYAGGSWTARHLHHFIAPCGKYVAGSFGDRRHAAHCKECKK